MRQPFLAQGRRVFIFVVCTLLASLQLAHRSAAQGNRPEQAGWGHRGQAALNRLGGRLPEVAARHKMTPAQLARSLRDDANLWLDPSDRLVYLDDFVAQEAPRASGGGSTAAAPLPYEQTFFLHSLPGATKTIYLDFDGHTTSGTAWNANFNGGADIVSTPFDMDGKPAFSNAELDRIQLIWQRVAEEYAPFAVDVTTQDPGVEALRNLGDGDPAWGIRVIISPTNYFYSSAGGVAYIGSFTWNNDTPTFAFTTQLGPNGEKYIADAVTHEVGHTLGLSHDGVNGVTAYYQGDADTGTPSWAPIMGIGYYQTLVQWSKGEYANANNLQDDLAIIATNNGFTYRNDDHSNALSGATPLTVNGTSVSGKGLIERTTDLDYFSFQTGAGTVSFNVTGNPRDANLDVQVTLYDANGTAILVNNPAGLSASFSTTLTAGTYYLALDGAGTGDPAQGYYSDYGSLGEFTISGTVAAATTVSQPSVMHLGNLNHANSLAKNGSWNATVTVTAHATGDSMLGGAAISGTFSYGAMKKTVSCVTSARQQGTCTMSVSGLSSATASVTFAVNNMTLSGYGYAAELNHDPDGSSNGVSVAIAKP
ncbi:MAG: hypothetical protein HOP19_00090 [Acidobacteria bacterium]|nr:hypothetical protein [Acidobacteriota bacterium]